MNAQSGSLYRNGNPIDGYCLEVKWSQWDNDLFGSAGVRMMPNSDESTKEDYPFELIFILDNAFHSNSHKPRPESLGSKSLEFVSVNPDGETTYSKSTTCQVKWAFPECKNSGDSRSKALGCHLKVSEGWIDLFLREDLHYYKVGDYQTRSFTTEGFGEFIEQTGIRNW